MPADTYLGIEREFKSYHKLGGSKFYGFLFPVRHLEHFEQQIKEFKQQFEDATHVCSACVIGINRETQRFSDDGEPSNSSGRPMLNALLSKNLTYVGTAVVRYYGGKKLGIPGLIEAYGGATQLCINQAEILELVLKDNIVCSIDEDKAYLLYNFLGKRSDLSYQVADGQFNISCAQSMTEGLRKELSEIDTLAF